MGQVKRRLAAPRKDQYGNRIVEVARIANILRSEGMPRIQALHEAERSVPKIKRQR